MKLPFYLLYYYYFVVVVIDIIKYNIIIAALIYIDRYNGYIEVGRYKIVLYSYYYIVL